ncbi:BLOC-1-related complex subunit 6 isoform X2 [Chrysoperla carnea]|uniref:BLOC-1-related complex subunit 6 isoform X2 n=1 Tax=Chrysoperla carnea TaxID=189513 RepID=UPI001D08BF14|nr:BLOC-1-related complex subunit 6 isoform X2 [Chrysoperla carnea]
MASESTDNSPSKPPTDPPPIFSPPLPARPPRPLPQPKLLNSNADIARTKELHDLECEQEIDEMSQQMTASYSEISFNSSGSPVSECGTAVSFGLDQIDSPIQVPDLPDHIKHRPDSLQYDKAQGKSIASKNIGCPDLHGTIHVDGNMTYFIAEDLEYKIKLSSPITKKNYTNFPGTSRSGTPNNLYRQILVPQFTQIDVNILADLECEAQRMATSIDNLTENLGGILHSMSSITADNVDIYKDAVSKMSDAMDLNIKGMYTIIAKAEEVSHTMKNVQYHAERIKEIKRLVDLFESNL